MNDSWFTETRGGLFIHYGLYSLLERGERVWKRAAIPREEDKAHGRPDDLAILDAAIHLQMSVVRDTLDRSFVVEIEMNVETLAGLESSEYFRNRLTAVIQVPGFGG